MKKLLFLTSVVLFAFQLSSCGNRKSSKLPDEPIVENETQNVEVVGDTAHASSTNEVSDTTLGKQIPKVIKVTEAPVHNAPEQAKIDSIKAAKAKERKK